MNMIIVGRDIAASSPSLARALIDSILTSTNVIDIGMIDTARFFAVNHLGARQHPGHRLQPGEASRPAHSRNRCRKESRETGRSWPFE